MKRFVNLLDDNVHAMMCVKLNKTFENQLLISFLHSFLVMWPIDEPLPGSLYFHELSS